MNISDIAKIEWEKGDEWFEKWYNTELCFLALHANPLTKTFIVQGLDSIAVKTQWFHEKKVSEDWDKDERKAAVLGPEFFQELVGESGKYILRAKIALKQIRNISKIDSKSVILVRKALMDLWYIFLADLGKYLGDRVDNMLSNKKLTKKQIEEIKNYYLIPQKHLAYRQENRDLKKIKDFLDNKHKLENITLNTLPKQVIKLLYIHQEKYSWLTTSSLDSKPASLNYYSKRLKELDASSNIVSIKPKLSSHIKSLLSNSEIRLLELINEHLYIDNYAADLFEKIDFLFQKLLSKNCDVSFQKLSWYTFSELELLVRKNAKLSSTDLRGRKKFRIMVQINGKIVLFYGKKNFDLIKKLLNKNKDVKVKSFKGNIACLGHVKGIVKIIRGIKDMDKVEKGDVIVANNTRPDLMPAIRRCIAIVTNYGGITSHAAIVSRELKIPCIVGTHIATDVLKDGDLVEVDADKGVVRILK